MAGFHRYCPIVNLKFTVNFGKLYKSLRVLTVSIGHIPLWSAFDIAAIPFHILMLVFEFDFHSFSIVERIYTYF